MCRNFTSIPIINSQSLLFGIKHILSDNTGTIGASRYFPEHKLQSEKVPDASKLTKKIEEFNGLANENDKLGDTEMSQFQKIAKKVMKCLKLSEIFSY